MKIKLVSLICLLFAVILSFNGCTGSKGSTIMSSEESSVEESSIQEEELIDNFTQYFGNLVDLEKYEFMGHSYRLKNINKISVDTEIKFDNLNVVSLPTDLKELEKVGWNARYFDSTIIESNKSLAFYAYNSDNKEIIVTCTNDTDKEQKPDACRVTDISVELTKIEQNSGTVKLSKSEYSPDFKLKSGITQDSTFEDVINSYGYPYSVECNSIGLGRIRVLYVDSTDSDSNTEIFDFWYNFENKTQMCNVSIDRK